MRERGFSLLELLLVLAIFAMLATFGIATYKQRTVNQKVTLATSEMQQILQSGTAFFVDKGEWPIFQTPAGEEFEKNYLPFQGELKNPWNLKYEYRPFSTALPDAKKAKLFQVETYVPTQGIADQLALQLPNSQVISSGHTYLVKAQIVIPGQNSGAISGFRRLNIRKIGKVLLSHDHRSEKIRFQCPEGMKKDLFITFSSIDSGPMPELSWKYPKRLWAIISKFSIDKTECDREGCSFALRMNYWNYCGDEGEGDCWKLDAKASLQYIAYCIGEKLLENDGEEI